MMNPQRLIKLLIGPALLLLFFGPGCERSAQPPVAATPSTHRTPPAQPAVAVSGAVFKQLVAQRGSITFRSWEGKWIGTDCDTDLKFQPGGTVILTEYRYAVDHYRGTYDIDAKGVVTVKLSKYASSWPVMLAQRDPSSLLLQPVSGQQGFSLGGGAGATISSGQGNYWPFRTFSDDNHGK